MRIWNRKKKNKKPLLNRKWMKKILLSQKRQIYKKKSKSSLKQIKRKSKKNGLITLFRTMCNKRQQMRIRSHLFPGMNHVSYLNPLKKQLKTKLNSQNSNLRIKRPKTTNKMIMKVKIYKNKVKRRRMLLIQRSLIEILIITI